MIVHNESLFTSGDKAIFRNYELEYGDLVEEQRILYNQFITDMKFHEPSGFYFFTSDKGKIVKMRATFTEKTILNSEIHIGIKAFDFHKERSLVILFDDGTLREMDIVENSFSPFINLDKDSSFFDV